MGYRQLEHKHHPPRRTMAAGSTPLTIWIPGGSAHEVAIPCWYIEAMPPMPAHRHCRDHHDHIGWPNPGMPDWSCQDHDFAHSCDGFHSARDLLDLGRVIPIHLRDEGWHPEIVVYDESLKPNKDYVTADVWIDNVPEDWVVRALFMAQVPVIPDDVKLFFSIYVWRETDMPEKNSGRRQQLVHGRIKLLPGSIPDAE